MRGDESGVSGVVVVDLNPGQDVGLQEESGDECGLTGIAFEGNLTARIEMIGQRSNEATDEIEAIRSADEGEFRLEGKFPAFR